MSQNLEPPSPGALERLARQPAPLISWLAHSARALAARCGAPCAELLAPMVGEDWARALDALATPDEPPATMSRADVAFEDAARRAAGIYFTPSQVSLGMAAAIPSDTCDGAWVLDLSAGDGSLLHGALTAHPTLRALGVEREPGLALACALRLAMLRAAQGWPRSQPFPDRVICGDGLHQWERLERLDAPIAAVLGNPPYVGEKGSAPMFQALRYTHQHLAPWFCARMDLSYLFMHRALELLPAGGRLIYLTSEYWLAASSAQLLRADLAARARVELFLRVTGAPLFEDAPGHHSLLTIATRCDAPGETSPRAASLDALPASWPEAITHALSQPERASLRPPEQGWQPFSHAPDRALAMQWRQRHAPLGQLVRDRQGFVSGADRVTRRHLSLLKDAGTPQEELPALGAPVYLMSEEEIPQGLRACQGELVVPLIRGSAISARQCWSTPPAHSFALYIDGPLEGQQLAAATAHLEPMRPVLSLRREVQSERMPWYRLHWPRARHEQRGPKIVCARRATGPVFGLDLSGSFLSSDCTYLVPRPDTPTPIWDLLWVLAALSTPESARDLECFGKRKGGLYELYSEPLRQLPLPLALNERGGLDPSDEAFERAWRARVERAYYKVTQQGEDVLL